MTDQPSTHRWRQLNRASSAFNPERMSSVLGAAAEALLTGPVGESAAQPAGPPRNRFFRTGTVLAAALLLAACGAGPGPVPSTTETAAPTEGGVGPKATTPLPTATPTGPQVSAEGIYLRSPGPGSRVASPLAVAGAADPTFEQSLLTRLVDFEGTVLAEGPINIDAPVGERGPFAGELAFQVSAERPAALLVLATSPRDGGTTHLAAHIVTLLPAGPEELRTVQPHPERIQIHHPPGGSVVAGGQVRVAGFGLASFEQTLVVEVQDATGSTVGQAPLTVEAPDLGQPGPFEVAVAYQVDAAGPGRIAVRDPSPAYGGPVHLNSVEVALRP